MRVGVSVEVRGGKTRVLVEFRDRRAGVSAGVRGGRAGGKAIFRPHKRVMRGTSTSNGRIGPSSSAN